MIRRRQHNHVLAAIVLVNADDIKQVHGEGDKRGVVILLCNTVSQRLRFFAAVGVDLQQAVAALLQLRFQLIMLRAAGFNQIVKTVSIFRCGQVVNQLTVHAVIDGAAGRAGVFKRVQPFVIPAHQHRLRGFFKIWHVDLNVVRLANTIQTADTLLEQIRVEGQIEHHQMAGELEVTPFRADFGAEQHLRAAILFREPGRRAVAFNNRHPFMEHCCADTFALAQYLLQLQRGRRFGADHQHLLRAVAGEVAHQPLDARVKVPPGAAVAFKLLIDLLRVEHIAGALFLTFARPHDAGDFNRRLVLGRQRQFHRVQFAFREAFDPITGVTEQYAAGAVAIHQHGDQLLARIGSAVAIAVRGLQQRLDILLAHQLAQHIEIVIAQAFARQQQRDGVGYRTVVLLLINKLGEIMETVRIEQAQTRKVALHTELFRRRGQQQNARHALGQLFNGEIFAARLFFAPHQVVRFIDHQQIPLGITEVFEALLAAAHEIERADHQLFGLERVIAIVLRFGITIVIKQRKAQVEAAQHLNQPLVLQGFRHHD